MSLYPGAHIHLMGIAGTAMASLAGILQKMGYRVTGSDQNIYPPMSTQLEALGIPVMLGYRRENLEPRPDLVIVGNVITRQMEEAQALLESDIPYTSLPKAMGEFVIADRESIVISGTHGKTTTTAIMAWLAHCVGLEPGYLIGGIPENFPNSFAAPKGKWFVIEGDEYDTAFFDKVPKFTHYRPRHVILTSIEFDHADIYRNLDDVKEAFRCLIQLIPPDGHLVAYADDPHVRELASRARCPVIFYGMNQGDYRIVDRRMDLGRNQFAVEKNGRRVADLALKVFGPANSLNALAAFSLAHTLGWPLTKILQGLAEFKGVRRRQQVIADSHGITIVEDFAHHPTAVQLTIEAMRERFPGRRLIAVFEPRSATSRRNVFQAEYAAAFAGADRVVLATPYDQSKIPEGERFSSDRLADDLRAQGKAAHVFADAESIVAGLGPVVQKGDVILIMSNGAFGGIYQRLISAALKD